MRITVVVGCVLASCAIGLAQTTHYLDCGAAGNGGDSLRPGSAWNKLDQANAFLFEPGDRLLLRRGSRCEGMLAPKGSGTAQASILLGAYGEGALPVIAGGAHKAGLQLQDQSYWEIENLEIEGGSPYGVHIAADHASIRHLHVRNLVIHHVTGEPENKDSGLLVAAPLANSAATISDVRIDGVTAYDTTEWAGIIVLGAGYNEHPHRYGEDITIRNSIVHDVAGDGILLENTRRGLIEHNVAWNTGMQEKETIGTPNAIWEWMCVDCRVAWNEGFFSDSPGVDGGVFDIDYGNVNNVVEHNFGHDSQGYCAAIFGAEGRAGDSTNSIVRENACLHNGRSPRLARRQGAIFAYTWHGGRLNGVAIERNTILWEPPLDAPAIQVRASFFGQLPSTIEGNRILLASGSGIQASPPIAAGANTLCMRPDAAEAADPAQSKSSADFCACWSEWRKQLLPAAHSGQQLPRFGHGWRLVAPLAGEASRSSAVLLESMVHQFGALGLQGVLVPQTALPAAEAEQLRIDWNLSARIRIAPFGAENSSLAPADAQALLLLAPDGTIAASWQPPFSAVSVWLELEEHLGTPAGMQSTLLCNRK